MKLGPTMEFDHIQPAIRKRFTSAADIPPKEVFSDPPDVYREELTRIFYGPPYWHPIAHRAELAERNAFRTRWLADVPLLMVRDGDDRIRVFVNSCAHRGGTLLEQRRCGGVAERFECPYHRWIFNNDGRFAGAPRRMQFRPDFREEDYGLRELHVVEAWGGLIFVSMAAQPPPFDDYLGDSADPLRDCMVDDGDLTLLGYQTVVFQSNWKTYIDNDPYHAPLLHSAFKLLNWQGGSGNVLVSEPYGHMSVLYDAQPYVDNGFLADPSVVTRMGGDDSRARVIALRPVTGSCVTSTQSTSGTPARWGGLIVPRCDTRSSAMPVTPRTSHATESASRQICWGGRAASSVSRTPPSTTACRRPRVTAAISALSPGSADHCRSRRRTTRSPIPAGGRTTRR